MKISLSLRDRAFAHCAYSNNPLPPVSFSELIEWDRTTPPGPKTIYTDAEIFTAPHGSAVAWLIEPIHGRPDAFEFLLKRGPEFKAVWTHDRELLAMLPNAVFVPFGGCWVAPGDRKIWPKSKNVSTIASIKRGGEGYDLRHSVIRKLKHELDAFGKEYRPLEHKISALRDYRFQVVIENSRHDFWFTEKLIDCFVAGTVPIYWGCPSVKTFFNTAGMMLADTETRILEAFDRATAAEYVAMLPAIRDNFERAKKYILAEDWIARTHPQYLEGLVL